MSTFQGAYKSLLQGVSQQQPHARLLGQVSAQINMVSDPVTGPRRRPGAAMRRAFAWTGIARDKLAAWFTDIAGQRVHILLNTSSGKIKILGEDFAEQAELDVGSYLVAADRAKIRGAAVGSEFFIANLGQSPVVQSTASGADPKNAGFFYVPSGAFGKTYSVTVVHPGGSSTATYTTPGGSGAGDAALSTPEYIATQLANSLSTSSAGAVRIEGRTFVGTTVNALEKNTGTASSPVWAAANNGDEFTIDEIANGKLRIRYNAGVAGGKFSVTFKTQVGGVWGSTVYTSSDKYLEWSEGATVTDYIDATLFTSNAPVSGDPNLIVARDGPYVFVSRSGGVSVSTSVGSQYLIASQGGFVKATGDLPARLPAAGNGFICRVGSGTSPQYYKYDHARVEWVETAKYGSPSAISNCPISVYWTGTAWAVNQGPFEGRLAGDDDSNPTHEFMQYGLTGLGTYQGRLVLMSGPLVSLSASNKPRRFFRSTVTSLLPNDPAEIGSSMNSSAAYEWAVPFQKDLILFSRAYQALIPSGNVAVSAATANVVPTSSHEVDTTSSPITLGRTLMYCNPRSADFFGAMEMIPSQYADSQYISQDATPHLPKYMGGRCRFAVSSPVASTVLFAPSGDDTTLIVHEYHWSGDKKEQQAWHQWKFPYATSLAYFVGDVVVLVLVQNGQVVMTTIDSGAGTTNSLGERRPFLDLNVTADIVANVITIPSWMLAFDPAIAGKLTAVSAEGALAGELVGTSVEGTTLRTVRSWPTGKVKLGLTYYSGLIPTPPQITDYNGDVVHDGKATVLRFLVGLRNSSDFEARISDAYSAGEPYEEGVLTFSSPELELGTSLFGREPAVVIPARTQMRSTALELSTRGVGEFNVSFLEYVGKFNPKIKRR